MIKNESDLFKEKIELFIQMSTVEAQFERLLKIETIYYTLSKQEQELIYEEFKRLLKLEHEKNKYLINDFFFGEESSEITEPSYSKSKLYRDLLNRYIVEQTDKAFELDDEIQKLPEEKQKEINESVKRLIQKPRQR